HEQRLGALEATALMQSVIEAVDVAVFAFDAGHRLRLVNPPGERVLGPAAGQLLRLEGPPLRLAGALPGEKARGSAPVLAGGRGRTLGGAARRLRPGRPAARAADARRRKPRAARGGAPGLAAADPRAEPRDQQLAGAHQLDRGQPARPARARAATARPRA